MVACVLCGGEVTSKNPQAYPYCRVCHYTGAAAEAESAEQLDRWRGWFPDAEVGIEHTGGGCFWFAFRWAGDPVYYCATDGEAQIPLDPETKRMLKTGGWGLVCRYHDDETHDDYEGTLVLAAEVDGKGILDLDATEAHNRYWDEYPAHSLTDEQVVAAIRADRERSTT